MAAAALPTPPRPTTRKGDGFPMATRNVTHSSPAVKPTRGPHSYGQRGPYKQYCGRCAGSGLTEDLVRCPVCGGDGLVANLPSVERGSTAEQLAEMAADFAWLATRPNPMPNWQTFVGLTARDANGTPMVWRDNGERSGYYPAGGAA